MVYLPKPSAPGKEGILALLSITVILPLCEAVVNPPVVEIVYTKTPSTIGVPVKVTVLLTSSMVVLIPAGKPVIFTEAAFVHL
ncbi:hypothetical protein D3C85_1678320 [compost metagenome]